MKSIQTMQDEHFKNVTQDRQELVSRQIELSEATYPLLVAYLLYLRQINSVHNRIDELNKNAQMLREFNYLCEHNLLFFLTVTGQFDVIRELFQDKAELAKVLALMDELEREYNIAAENQQYALLTSKTIQATTLPKANKPPLDLWAEEVYGINAMKLYQYYEQELKRVTFQYNVKQTKLYSHTSAQRILGLERAIAAVKADDGINSVAKKAFLHEAEALKVELIEKQAAQDNAYADFISSGSQDIQAYLDSTKILFEATDKIGLLYINFQNISPELQKIFVKFVEETQVFSKQFQADEQEFSQQKEEITTHLENVQKAAMEHVDKKLNSMIQNISKLEIEQHDLLKAAVVQLKVYKEELKTADSFDTSQLILNKCDVELKKIKQILNPLVSESLRQKVDTDLLAFHKTIISPQGEQKLPEMEEQPSIQETKDTKEISSRYRFFVNSTREVQKASETMPVDEEYQNDYQMAVKEMVNSLDLLKENLASNSEMLSKVEKLEHLLKNAETLGFDKANESDLKEIYSIVGELGVEDSEMFTSQENLSLIFKFLEESPQKTV